MQNIILIILSVGLLLTIFVLFKKSKKMQDDGSLRLLLEQMNELSRVVDRKIGENTKEMNESMRLQFSESQRLATDIRDLVHKQLREVAQGVAETKESTRQVFTIAEQLQNLEDILKNPKQRGILGEYYLENLLKNVLPPGQYKMQYAFSNGDIVDAVVFVKDKIIPIDSKFSLENYNRLIEAKEVTEKERLEKIFVNDLKNRIVETSKYIKPSENTMDFAFMFIPHEAIYYDLLVNKIGGITNEDTENLIQKSASKYKVIIISPTSFLAYLQTVLQGLKAMQIEETAKDIIKRVGELSSHLKKYEEYHNKLGNSINTVVNHYSNSNKELGKIDKDVTRLTGSEIGFELPQIDKVDIAE